MSHLIILCYIFNVVVAIGLSSIIPLGDDAPSSSAQVTGNSNQSTIEENLEGKLRLLLTRLDDNGKKIQSLEKKLIDNEKKLLDFKKILIAQKENRPWTFNYNYEKCGGAVDLSEYGTLTYVNSADGSLAEQEETCVWLLKSNFNEMSLTLLNASFAKMEQENSTGGVMKTSRLTLHAPQTNPISATPIYLQEVGKPIQIENHFILLTFTGTFGQGFELKLRSSGTSKIEESYQNSMVILEESVLQKSGSNTKNWLTYSYPKVNDNQPLVDERRMIVVKPSLGQKLQVVIDVTSNVDSFNELNVLRFSKNTLKYDLLKSYSNSEDPGDETLDRDDFWADEGDFILIYLQSDASSSSHQFRFQYTFDAASKPIKNYYTCGGVIHIPKERHLTYVNQNLSTNQTDSHQAMSMQTCIWVISSRKNGFLNLTLSKLTHTNGSLVIQRRFEGRPAPIDYELQSEDVNKTIQVPHTHFFLIFTSSPDDNFQVNISYAGQSQDSNPLQLRTKFVDTFDADENGTRSFLFQRDVQENSYVILKQDPRGVIKVRVDQIQAENFNDYISIFKFSSKSKKFLLLKKFDRTLNDGAENHLEGEMGQPILIYVHFKAEIFELSYWLDESNKTVATSNEFQNSTLTNPTTNQTIFENPIEDKALTPSIYFEPTDGFYYWVIGEGNQIYVRKSKSLVDWSEATEKTVFFTPPTGSQVELPRIQKIGGIYYIYFQMVPWNGWFYGRMFVIQSQGDKPDSEYGNAVRLKPDKESDYFAKEALVTENLGERGQLHLVWSGRINMNSYRPYGIYIAPLKNPMEIGGASSIIHRPQGMWEGVNSEFKENQGVNECPQVLYQNGKAFLFFSANEANSDDYCMGMMSIEISRNPAVPSNWNRGNDSCIFGKVKERVYSVGRFSLTTSTDGSESWILYQARNQSGSGTGKKTVRAQKFEWDLQNELPRFSSPVSLSQVILKPSSTVKSEILDDDSSSDESDDK